jgi:hypothetical protein
MLFGQIFLYDYIIKVSPRLTLYRLKDKKGVGRLMTKKEININAYCKYTG